MISQNKKISLRQLQALILLDLFGVGTMLAPLGAAHAGADGWVAVLIATVVAALAAYAFTALPIRKAGALCAVVVSVRVVVGVAYRLRLFTGAVTLSLLPKTPWIVVCGVMAALGAYAAAKGMEARGRLAELLLPPTALAVLCAMAFAITDMDASNLTPMFQARPTALWGAAIAVLPMFGGVELCAFAPAFLSKPKAARRGVVWAVAVSGGLAAVVTLAATARFGAGEMGAHAFPALRMMDASFPVALRLSAFLMTFWMFSMFSVAGAGIVVVCRFIEERRGAGRWAALGVAAVMAAAACVGMDALKQADAALGLAVLPVALCAGLWARRKEKRGEARES